MVILVSPCSIQGLVAHFMWFLGKCSIRVDPMYGSGHGFLRQRALILLSLATQLTTIRLGLLAAYT